MNKKEVYAWAIYDLANTIFSALFITLFFPFFIKEFLKGTEFQISLVFGISMIFVAITIPFIGSLSDIKRRRIPFMIFFTILCCIFTFIVAFVGLIPALIFGAIANYFYHSALAIYNALLYRVSTKNNFGLISGIGVGLGYVGTLISIGLVYLIFNYYGWESINGIKAIFISTALLFFIFSIPTFILIKEERLSQLETNIFSEVKKTFSNFIAHKQTFTLFLSNFMFVNAIDAVIIFLYLYARSIIGLSLKEFLPVFLLFSITAALGSVLVGKLTDNIGPKKILRFAGYLWILVILLLINVSTFKSFLIAGVIGSIALGSVWTAIRPYTIILSPVRKLGQFFGYLELTNKFSGVIGTVIFGFLATYYNYDIALTSLLIFFILGLIILGKVKEK